MYKVQGNIIHRGIAMLDYKLALELKENGYPQTGSTYWHYMEGGELSNSFLHSYAACPTLSELIEVCGDDFTKLLRCRVIQPGTEGATYMFRAIDSNGLSTELCKTPEEAVARLFIAINKEEDV